MLKRLIGYTLLSMPFIALYIFGYVLFGNFVTCCIFATVGILIGIMVMGFSLIS